METRHQEQQGQAPSQPWYPTPPPPPPPGGFHQFPQYSLPHQQPPAPQLQSYHQQPPLWKPAVPDFTPYHQLQQPSRPGLLPPLPPSTYHHGMSPPFPNGPPAYLPHGVPPPPSYVNASQAQQNYPIPPPNQVWGNSNWHHPQGWDHPARSMSYNNEEDWAARAREWVEGKSSTENHHNPIHIPPVCGMESHSQVYHEPLHQAAGPPTESQQSSYSTSQQTPISTAVLQRQANPMQDTTSFNLDPSSYSTDARMQYGTRPESFTEENGNTKSHGNFSSSVFAQEVPSTYSSSSGKNDGDQNKSSSLPLPPPHLSFQEGPKNSNATLQFQSIKIEQQLHPVHGCMAPSIDASDQPLAFNQRFNFDHGQNQNTSYRDVDISGSFRGIESIGVAPSSLDGWTPSVAFSQMATIPSGQQAPMFGRMPAPGFHPSIPSIRAPFGVGAGTLNHLSAFQEDSGAFSSVERPKKASVPNWLREELLKKKASITSNLWEKPIGNSHSGEGGGDDKSLENDDHADNKNFDSAKSGEDDDDDEDDVEAKRTAVINQEIKLVLTDILLKVTDDLFEEIATKVINEDDDLTLEVEVNESSVNLKASLSPLASAAPKSSSKIPVTPGSITRIEQVEKSASVPVGNILGLANYASDDEDEEAQSSVTISSVTLDGGNQQKINNVDSVRHTVKMEEEETRQIKIEESDRGSLFISSRCKEKSLDGALQLGERNNRRKDIASEDSDDKQYKVASEAVSGTSERPFSVPSEKDGKAPFEHDDDSQRKQSVKETPSKEEKIVREKRNGQLEYHDTKSGSTAGSVSRDADKGSREETEIGTPKLSRQYSDANELRKGCVDSQTKAQTGKYENIGRSCKESKQDKSVDKSESRKRNIHESEKSSEDSERYKSIRYNEENPRKRDRQEDRKEDRAGREEKDSHRHGKKHSPSPSGRHINSKNNASSSYGGVSSGDVSADPKKRKTRSERHSLSQSSPRSNKKQVSRSPRTKHSQRKHSPHSYSKTRRRSRSRSNSPVRRKR